MKTLVIYLILCFIGSGITNMNTGADSAAAADEPVCENVCVAEDKCEAEEAFVIDTAYDLSDEYMFAEEDQDTADEPADDKESDVSASAVPVVKNTEVPVTVVSDPVSDEDTEWDDDCGDDEDYDCSDDEDYDCSDDEDDEDWEDDQDIDDDDEDDGDPAELIPGWPLHDGDPDETIYPEPMRPWYVHNQVMFLADSEEEAQGVADEYGLTLESFSYGVAVLNTGDTDACDVVAYGRENGLTPVELNHIIYLDDPVERFQPIRWERHEIIDDDPDTDPGDDTVPDDDE